jgi:hypothetical protein
MEKFIDSKIGLCMCIDGSENVEDYIKTLPVTLANEVLTPGEFTTLSNFFKIPIQFSGVLKENKEIMCFYLGNDENLFDSVKIYDCYYYISPTRFFDKYRSNSGRDFNLVNGVWK